MLQPPTARQFVSNTSKPIVKIKGIKDLTARGIGITRNVAIAAIKNIIAKHAARNIACVERGMIIVSFCTVSGFKCREVYIFWAIYVLLQIVFWTIYLLLSL
jgi:hypothetical protein